MDLADYFIKEIKKYHWDFMKKKVLRTMEEVEANTDEYNIPSAMALAELNNDLRTERKVLSGKWSVSENKKAYTIGTVDIPAEKIQSISGIVNNDSAFLYAYSQSSGISLGIRYVGTEPIANRDYTVIIVYKQ